MAATASRSSPSIAILFLLLIATPPPSQSFSYSEYLILFSIAPWFMSRVANLRAAQGDLSGANRARAIAEKLELLGFFGLTYVWVSKERGLGMGFWSYVESAGCDYLKNYAGRDVSYSEMYGAVSGTNELLCWMGELIRAESYVQRVAWVGRNYQNVLRLFSSKLRRLPKVFRQSWTSREVVETVQREVVDDSLVETVQREVVAGGLLRDCLEIVSNDLKGSIQILKDLGFTVFSFS